MKKICMVLAVLMLLSLAACGAGNETPTAAPTETPSQAVSPLEIRDIGYQPSGTIADFQVDGTIVSGYELVRMEVDGELIAESAGNIVVVSDDADPYYFGAGTYSVELSALREYFADHYSGLYNLFLTVATGGEERVTGKLTCVCYDASGASESFTLDYLIVENTASAEDPAAAEDAASGIPGTLTVSGLEYPMSGTIEGFRIAGTISSEHPLSRVTGSGTVSSVTAGVGVSDVLAAFSFEEGTNTAELAELEGYVVEQMNAMLTTYETIAGLLDETSGDLEIKLDFTCYDIHGNTVNFTVIYKITVE